MKLKTLREETAEEAFKNPRVGDYWSEHFCPYFVIVKIDGDDFYVLSAIGGTHFFNRKHELNAKIDFGGKWGFDYSKAMIVDKAWITKAVKYGSIEGFVADATRGVMDFVKEWKEYFEATPYEVPRVSDLILAKVENKVIHLVKPWEARALEANPKSDPEYWPDSLKLKYALAEISDLRVLLSKGIKKDIDTNNENWIE